VDTFRALVLGIVQGLTEFIPISSSGHLVLIPDLLGWPDQGLAFDAALHIGTLVAVLGYFRADWIRLTRAGLVDVHRFGLRFGRYGDDARLLLLIAAGTVPAAVAGLAFDDWIEANLREAWNVAVALIAAGLVMFGAERMARLVRPISSVRLRDALVIGLAQACALVPGVSRSGATMSAGLVLGLRREDAARFAFLLGTPAFAGAALLKSFDLADASRDELLNLAVGMLASAIVGFMAISWLLRFLRTRSLLPFVVYRCIVGVGALAVLALRAL